MVLQQDFHEQARGVPRTGCSGSENVRCSEDLDLIGITEVSGSSLMLTIALTLTTVSKEWHWHFENLSALSGSM